MSDETQHEKQPQPKPRPPSPIREIVSMTQAGTKQVSETGNDSYRTIFFTTPPFTSPYSNIKQLTPPHIISQMEEFRDGFYNKVKELVSCKLVTSDVGEYISRWDAFRSSVDAFIWSICFKMGCLQILC